jgi:hypothetical protein
MKAHWGVEVLTIWVTLLHGVTLSQNQKNVAGKLRSDVAMRRGVWATPATERDAIWGTVSALCKGCVWLTASHVIVGMGKQHFLHSRHEKGGSRILNYKVTYQPWRRPSSRIAFYHETTLLSFHTEPSTSRERGSTRTPPPKCQHDPTNLRTTWHFLPPCNPSP